MRSVLTARFLASSFTLSLGAASLVAGLLLAPAPAHAQINGFDFANVADNTGPFSDIGFGAPALNASGQVAFRANLRAGGSGIFAGTTTGATLTTVASTAGQFSSFSESPPSLNASGQVAFVASLRAGGPGLFVGNTAGADPTIVADTTGQFNFFIESPPSLNASGQVAFVAGLRTAGPGIYTGTSAGGLTTRVIGSGDALFGSRVTGVNLNREALNDNGQIAFTYQLMDGRWGIAVASIAAVPEPGTLALAALPLAAMAIRRRRNG